MALGDMTLFDEFPTNEGQAKHNFDSDQYYVGLVTGVTPDKAVASPSWDDYSSFQISQAGGYTGPVLQDVEALSEAAGVTTLRMKSFTVPKSVSGQPSATCWGILYNGTSAGNPAVLFMELGAVDIQNSQVDFLYNNAAIDSYGTIFTKYAA